MVHSTKALAPVSRQGERLGVRAGGGFWDATLHVDLRAIDASVEPLKKDVQRGSAKSHDSGPSAVLRCGRRNFVQQYNGRTVEAEKRVGCTTRTRLNTPRWRKRAIQAPGWATPIAIAFVAFALALGVASGLKFEVTQIGQAGSCTSAGNAIHVTLQADTKLYNERSAANAGNTELETSLTVSQVVATSSGDGTLRVAERSRVFSGFALLADNLFSGSALDTVYVDNAEDAGLGPGDRVRIDNEVFLVSGVSGFGCPRSSVVHEGCWSTLKIERAQHGTSRAVHFMGALVYRVVVGSVQDAQALGPGLVGVGNEKELPRPYPIGFFSYACWSVWRDTWRLCAAVH